MASTATVALLPNARTQFISAAGIPFANGTVAFYVPSTLVAKDTWQDSAGTILNTNPITLDDLGSATIWGAGYYRQILKDALGDTIWDQTTLAPQIQLDTGEPVFSTIAVAEAAQVLAGTLTLSTTGATTAGDGGGSRYVEGAWTAGNPGVIQTADGAEWKVVSQPLGNSARTFGVVANGATNYTTYVTAGTDDAAALQQAVDFNAYFFGSAAVLPQAVCRLNTTLQLGYGNTFTTSTVTAVDSAFVNTATFSGAGLSVNFTDRPVINVQGGRGSGVSNVGIVGPYAAFPIAQNFCNDSAALLDDTLVTNWTPSSGYAANWSSQYAPAAGISVDGLSGSQPATHYPTVTYPSWTGINSQYGKSLSSRTLIRNVLITGVNTALVITPSNATGNGDFTSWDGGFANYCVYGISVGQTQSRAVGGNFLQFAYIYCCATNIIHGTQQGEFGSDFKNWTLGQVIKLHSFGQMGEIGVVKWTALYAEGLYKLGELSSGGVATFPITIENASLSFDLQTPLRGIPAAVMNLRGSPGQAVGGVQFYTIRDSNVGTFYRVFPIMASALLENVSLFSALQATSMLPTYQALALNALSGGLVTPLFFAEGVPHVINFPRRDLDAGTVIGPTLIGDQYTHGQRNNCIPLYGARSVVPRLADSIDVTPAPTAARIVNNLTVSGGSTYDQATGVIAYADVRTQDQLEFFGGAQGDVLQEINSNTILVVRAITYGGSAAVTAEGWNNLYTGSSSCSEVVAWPVSPVFNVLNTRIYNPAAVVVGTSTTGGSATTLNLVLSSWGTTGETPVAGDRIFFTATDNPFGLTPATAKIAAVSAVGGGSATITLSGAGATIAATARIAYFIRQPPANA